MDPFYKRSLSSSSSSFGSHPLRSDAAEETGTGDLDVPKPLNWLHETPIPPFLSKTYDLVDDPRLDQIISWSDTGASFVVWEPVEFSRRILPKNFKHNNLSSFVRQLNTYGFRKIDTDSWEFACESFLRGKRHLLKNIRRRRSLPAQQQTEESSSLSVEAEVDRLQKDKMEMMQEVIDLQNQQRGTHQYMEAVNQKLQAAEDRQKQMVSSLAKVFQTSKFKKDRPTGRKYIKHEVHDRILDSQDLVQVKDPFPKQELDFSLDYDAAIVKQEDIWNSDFETVSGSVMPNTIWDDGGHFEYPEFGLPGGELSEFWNLADLGAENWMSGEASKSQETNQYGF
ncbi:heat stress transcription factor A-3-like isoform X2 [Bidens hawaiensis]|uniref:heat stress transcription factor A-3-like isoform X2 n=1 Tax=Bidens hawaiensis TaxID=980011 RepID=UPI00404AE72A